MVLVKEVTHLLQKPYAPYRWASGVLVLRNRIAMRKRTVMMGP